MTVSVKMRTGQVRSFDAVTKIEEVMKGWDKRIQVWWIADNTSIQMLEIAKGDIALISAL